DLAQRRPRRRPQGQRHAVGVHRPAGPPGRQARGAPRSALPQPAHQGTEMNSTAGRVVLSTLAVTAALGWTGTARAARGPSQYLQQPDAWFSSAEALRIAANVLSYQAEAGGWPKNVDTTAAPYTGQRKDLKPTFDNGATTDELRFLARVFDATKDDVYRRAFLKGLDYILQAQYPTGGWPQFHPPGTGYHRHITFNDDAMMRLMHLLREVATTDRYGFLDAERRTDARRAFDRGVECILRCQIVVEGKPAAWCAQHDEKDYRPRPGRTYELVSLSGSESIG